MAGEALQQALMPVVQAGLNYAVADISSAKAKQRNMQLMKYANEMSIENWNRQNEYNAPSSQMKRLAEAGLNPNMMYGSGQGANTVSDIGKVSAPQQQFRMEAPNVLGMLGQFQDLSLKKAQIDNVNAQTSIRSKEVEYLNRSMQSRIDEALFKAGILSEKEFQANALSNAMSVYGGGSEYSNAWYREPFELNLEKEQESVRSLRLQNEMREMENSWYKALKAMGASSQIINSILPFIQMFMPRKSVITRQ